MHQKIPGFSNLALISVIAACSIARAAPTLINLGLPPGGTTWQVRMLSTDGSAIAGVVDSSGTIRANRCTIPFNTPVFEDLGVLPTFATSRGFGISGDGQTVVGSCVPTGSISPRAFRWTPTQGIQDLGEFPGGGSGDAQSANRDGSIIIGYGYPTNPSPRRVAFRWTTESGMLPLPTLPNTVYSDARAISADGSFIGGSTTFPLGASTSEVATIWTSSGVESLGFLPGGNYSVIRAISSDGSTAVGRASSLNGYRAFRWTRTTGMQTLGDPVDSSDSNSIAINRNGSLIGGTVRIGSPYVACVWTNYRGCVLLREALLAQGADLAGWVLDGVVGISDDGTTLACTGSFNGQSANLLIRNFDPSRLICAADFNLDRTLDFFDYLDFVSAFAANSSSADFNQDSVIDFFDYLDFVAAFAASC